MLLALGEYGDDQRADLAREPRVKRLLSDYRDDPDPGIHSALDWLLRRWGMAKHLTRTDRTFVETRAGHPLGEVTKPRWFVNGQGQTFAVIPAPGEFEAGSPPTEKGRFNKSEIDYEDRRRVRIDYPFAVSLKLVTVTEFEKFRPRVDEFAKQWSPGEDTPMNGVNWYDVAAYCNWLSEQERIPQDQWCYEPNANGKYAEGINLKANHQSLSGYRLPREAEWEYCCRAGTTTAWSPGSDVALLEQYAWYVLNAISTMHPVGTLKPNGLGLFDMHGNAYQWCQEAYSAQEAADTDTGDITNARKRI